MSSNKTSILIDGNNLIMRCLFIAGVDFLEEDTDFTYLEWICFNSIVQSIRKFKAGEVILALDDKSWRKMIYEPYKADRAERREKKEVEDGIDWKQVYAFMNQMFSDWSETFPFKALKVKHAEADDVIGVLAPYLRNEAIVISVDEDYNQLLKYPHVKIWQPIKKEYRTCPDPERYLVDISLRGQKKDNVYNILTPLDFDKEKYSRKHTFTDKMFTDIIDNIGLDKWLDEIGPEEFENKNKSLLDETNKKTKKRLSKLKDGKQICLYETELRDRYSLNRKILDFEQIPDMLQKKIIESYHAVEFPNPDRFYPYFEKRGWRGFLEEFSSVERVLLNLY